MPGSHGPPVARLQIRNEVGDTIEWRTPWSLRIADSVVPIIAVPAMGGGAGWVIWLGAKGTAAGWRDSSWVGAGFGLAIAAFGAAIGLAGTVGVLKTKWGELCGTRWVLDNRAGTAVKFGRSLLGHSARRAFAAEEVKAVCVQADRWSGRETRVSVVWLVPRSGENVFVAGGHQVELMDALAKDLAKALRVGIDRRSAS